jgi:hypothetical protein
MRARGHILCTIYVAAVLIASVSCVPMETKNSLAQHTGEAGSAIPKAHPPYYPNTAGNIVAPPGNPAGAPPIMNGTENQSGGWPIGR